MIVEFQTFDLWVLPVCSYSSSSMLSSFAPTHRHRKLCDVSNNLVEASNIWNLITNEGFDVEIDGVEKMMEMLD